MVGLLRIQAWMVFPLLLLSLTVNAWAIGDQPKPPWPDGCSVQLPLYVQRGLDKLFLNACTRHDQCWATCNGEFAPFLGLGHKAQCDLTFLSEMEAACVAIASTIVLPFGDIDNVTDFIEDCSTVAATFFVAVATPLTDHIFWESQCIRGCNRDACPLALPPRIRLEPPCGTGLGPCQCYLKATPSVDFCRLSGVTCDGWTCENPNDLERLCCQCRFEPPVIPQLESPREEPTEDDESSL